MPGWCRSSPTSSVRRHRLNCGRQRCRRSYAPSTSTSSARHGAISPSSRWRATSASVTTSKRLPSPGPTSSSPGASASSPTASGTRCSRPTMKRQTSGRRSCPARGSSDATRRRTSGRWASLGPAGRRRRSSTTKAPSMAKGAALRLGMRTGSSRCGTSFSCRTSRTSHITSSATCPPRASTPGWAWSGWRPCFRGCLQSSMSTRSRMSGMRRPRIRDSATAKTRCTTSPSASSPIMAAPSPS